MSIKLKSNEYRAACRGCHGGCVHILTVEDGKVVGVRPDPDAPLSQGHACEKGLTIIEQMYHPDRLLHPLRRAGERGSGKWEQISWDEALDTIAEKLNELRDRYGPESISTITGTGRHLVSYLKRFGLALGTPNIASAGAVICLGPRKNAGFSTAGVYSCVDYYGDVRPECIVVWGANPAVSGADGELQWHPQECMEEGCKFIVIDPQCTEQAKKADLWLRIRPGTDGALALGILNIIIQEDLYDHDFVENWTYGFDELKERCAEYDLKRVSEITWIPEEQILQAARMMAGIKPMTLEWGCAIDQSFNSMQTCRAIYMIPALTGNYDVPGGFIEGKRLVTIRREPDDPGDDLINDYPYRYLRQCAHPHQVLDAIKMEQPYKIRCLLSFANNSLLSLPDSQRVYESLKELDFFVCSDCFMTPTAELADIVLPAALWPELDCIFYMPEYSEQVILCQQKVVQVGECRSDEDIFIELSRRMGIDYGADDQRSLLDQELAAVAERCPELKGMTFEKMAELGYYVPKGDYYRYKKRGGFFTTTGKFELWSTEVDQLGGDPLPDWQEPPVTPVSRPDLKRQFPYILTTGGRRMQYFISNNRQIRSLRRQYPFPLVRMNPETAKANNLKNGDWAYIRTFRGRITQKVCIDENLDPAVINCDFGWWYPEVETPDHGWRESNANILTSCDDGCDDYMGSYQLRTLLCNIYKNPDGDAIEARYYRSRLYYEPEEDSSSRSIVISGRQCILCRECVRTCESVQGIGALEVCVRDGITMIAAVKDRLADTDCVGCGQCRATCSTGALRIRSDIESVQALLADENTYVVAQVAPSVRVGVGGHLGFEPGENAMPKLVDLLRRLGFDQVYDTVFSADLTVVEEGHEFLERLERGDKLPLLTSCCPAWVKYCETYYPEFAENISTCRSPQQMLGPVIRAWYDKHVDLAGKRLAIVSFMPCTAKKAEIRRPESWTNGVQDVDFSLTTVELLQMLQQAGLSARDAAPAQADAPFSLGSGGGTLFGVTGGVTEAVLRYLSPVLGLDSVSWTVESGVRGFDAVKRTTVDKNGTKLNIAVVSGLSNAKKILDRVKAGEESYDLIEVMACPGGCIMGGGEPTQMYERLNNREARSQGLYQYDERYETKSTQDNITIQPLWDDVILGHEHELLHRNKYGAQAENGQTSSQS